jgi:ABC-type glycerol-3-phosphate transport system permease component
MSTQPMNLADLRRRVAVFVLLALASLMFIYPTVQMAINSFKSNDEIVANPAGLPLAWTLSSYGDVLSFERGLGRNLLNSVLVAGTSTCIAVILCAAAAYGFAKYEFRGRDAMFAVLLGTMMVPPEVLVPGQFVMFARLDLIDTLTVQILPTLAPVLGLFLVRQYMLTIPDELLDAARIDGAGEFTIFWRVILPVASPALSAYAILHFLSDWNQYLWPSLVATADEVKPIMVRLPQLVDSTVGFLPVYGTIMAGCVLATVPLVIVFIIFQDKFMDSVTTGAVK